MSSIPTVSILVPIYNVEKYLPQCLDSLVNQTLKSIEIICLNDGSTDSSLEILHSYAAKDDRIVIIDKPNSGYGDSMNLGLAVAKGKYIGIVESDDWIELDAFEKLYQLASWHQADVVKANYFKFSGGKNRLFSEISPRLTGKVFGSDWQPDSPQHLIERRGYRDFFQFAPAIWSAIYRREFLEKNDIKFLPTPGASYQDTSFNFKVWALAERVVFTSDAFVHYRLDNSNSSVNDSGKVSCIVDEYAEIENFLKARDLYSTLSGVMWSAKFGNYHWNFQRLPPKLAKPFFATLRSEFLAADAAGVLKRKNFRPEHWFALQLILKQPILAYRLLRIRSALFS